MPQGWLHPRDHLAATMARIYRRHLTTTSGGNLSIRDEDPAGLWITPSRVDKGALTAADMVRLRGDGTREGLHPPSSEHPFHREIYRRRPDLGALVHAHPGALVAFSMTRRLPETRVQTHVHAICGQIAFAPYACPGTEELGRNIAAAFAGGADCVLLENHGVVVGGRDLGEAFQRFETLEFLAQTLVRAAQLGPVSLVPAEALQGDPRPTYAVAPDGVPGFHERELRAELCRFVHRAYEQRLCISTAGAFSARLGSDAFVVTPRRRDRLDLEPAGLVRVEAGACPATQAPSRAAALHAAIYRRLPQAGAIINAQPVHASAFCLVEVPFRTHTIPESALVLRDVPRLPFRRLVEEAEAIAAEVSLPACPAVLIANEGALVLGRNLLEAFDRLEVLEATAEALLLAQPLGPVVPMPPAALEELQRVFGL